VETSELTTLTLLPC